MKTDNDHYSVDFSSLSMQPKLPSIKVSRREMKQFPNVLTKNVSQSVIKTNNFPQQDL